jgi:hypothetical protein
MRGLVSLGSAKGAKDGPLRGCPRPNKGASIFDNSRMAVRSWAKSLVLHLLLLGLGCVRPRFKAGTSLLYKSLWLYYLQISYVNSIAYSKHNT